ncbi:unnamed protein product [Miscanthus lutarioriparius]|uniref:Uncharacterized protein n=1 Tax=Miscanthus lutarioriparius TaxID=422564 RepID=A0A811R6J6_9POAL|nr:unnamed protein product [Miscanthus lutarioriparius]
MAVVGGWGSVGEMVWLFGAGGGASSQGRGEDSCVYADSDEIGAVKVPKEHHAAVAAHQFRGWCLRFVLRDGYFAIVLVNPLVIIRLL